MNYRVIACIVSSLLSVAGQTPTVEADVSVSAPRTFDGAEGEMLDDAADGRLDRSSLFDAALLASGLQDAEEAATCRARFGQFRASLARTTSADTSQRDRARKIFRRLHQDILTGQYRTTCTELHRTLDDGHYNCVTATVLYRCVCTDVGVPIKAIAETGHVYCLLAGDEATAIQTTSRDGFGTSETSNDGREITDVQLLAKIYFNRAVSLLEQDRFHEAFDLLQISYQLDRQDRIVWRNILACINNWALSECDAGRFQHGVELLLHGLNMAPDYRPFLDNELHVHHRWVSQLCANGHFEQALEILESGYRRRPDAPLFDDGRLAVYQAWKETLRASGKTDEAAEAWRRSADR